MHYPAATNCCLYQGQYYPEEHRQAPIGVHLKVSSCKYLHLTKSDSKIFLLESSGSCGNR